MKGLWIGLGAAAVVAGGAVVGVASLSESEPVRAQSVHARVQGPVQGSSFSAPAIRKEAPAAGSPLATPAPVSAPPAAGENEAEATPTPVAVAAALPAKTPASAAVAAAGGANAGYESLKFDVLAGYKYEEPKPALGSKPGSPPPTPIPNQIPATVTALDGRKVDIEGYMVPMEVTDDGKVKTFILTKNQPQCCFGDVEAPNEWIDVKMQPETYTDFMLDRPVKVQGTIEVGEKMEDGFLVSLYRMTADKVDD